MRFRDALRLVSMLLMLVILGLTIYQSRRLSSLREPTPLAPPGPALAEREAQEPAPEIPPEPGPEDDPEQAKAFQEESQLITDRATSLHPVEMPAYWRVLRWIAQQPIASLKGRAREASFRDLVHHPSRYRGKLLHVDLDVRRISAYDAPPGNRAGVARLYELWGWPTAQNGWLYVAVVPELPEGLAPGERVDVPVSLYGYFFKLQGYQPADAKPNARPLIAPLIVGRVAAASRVATPVQSPRPRYVLLVIIATILIAIVGAWLMGRSKVKPMVTSAPPAGEETFLPPHATQAADEHDASGEFDWLKE